MSTENRNNRQTILIIPNNTRQGYRVTGNYDTTTWQTTLPRTQEPAINF